VLMFPTSGRVLAVDDLRLFWMKFQMTLLQPVANSLKQ
jgi:hypothetical protein